MSVRPILAGIVVAISTTAVVLLAQETRFHDAPASAARAKNPYAGQSSAIAAGKTVYSNNCASCHGSRATGMGNVPSLVRGPVQKAKPGELFWFITHGDIDNGMPAWGNLPERDRWQVVTYLQSLGKGSPASSGGKSKVHGEPTAAQPGARKAIPSSPPQEGPFTDYRGESPGNVRKITVQDLPAPYATKSASNGPDLVPRPADAWPKAPAGFKVELYATGLDNPRLLRTAPNGDIFLAEMDPGKIKIFRGITPDGKADQTAVFATGLNQPFGIQFYPPGPNPQWIYVANTDSVVRFPYQNGDLKARGEAQHIADLPGGSGHTTRDVQFSLDGKKMWVSVGSRSNVDDPDTHPAEKNRADILEFNPDGTGMRVYASGIRNAVGLAVHPKSGELWCSVNERDVLGDNLVPDYITHVQDGGFYGWPWYYIGSHQDPHHAGKHPELADKVIVPDVLLNPHNASLQLTFYGGKQFPAEYQGDIFASEHGSWNRSIRVGYEVIRIPLHGTTRASGEYEDFVTGFVTQDGNVWGRPVGITVAPDGSLLFSDDGSNSIWRVTFVGGNSPARR